MAVFVYARTGCHKYSVSDSSKAPINPSKKDCQLLSKDLYQKLSAAWNENSTCSINAPIKFHFYTDCNGNNTYTVYDQCLHIRESICELKNHTNNEIKLCNSRARETSARDARLEQELRRANELTEQTSGTIRFLNNPEMFLKKSLSPYPQTLDRLFGPSRDKMDTSLAEEIYRYADNQAKGGTYSTKNPAIRQIQSTALKHVSYMFNKNLDQLDSLNIQMKELTTQMDKKTPVVQPSRCLLVQLCQSARYRVPCQIMAHQTANTITAN